MIMLNKHNVANFDNIQWVVSALDLKEKHRDMCKTLFVIDGKAYGTNGHRLHVAPIAADVIPGGSYQIIKTSKTDMVLNPCDEPAPTFSKVIPAKRDSDSVVNAHADAKGYASVIRAMPAPSTLEYGYFMDAARGVEGGTVNVPAGMYEPVRFDGENGNLAVVMPLRG